MSVDSENKSSESRTIAPYNAENGTDGGVEGGPVTPEMVLRLPTITDSMFHLEFKYCCLFLFSNGFMIYFNGSNYHNLPLSQYSCFPFRRQSTQMN